METVQVFRNGQGRTYVLAEEHEDGTLLLTPEAVPMPRAASAVGSDIALLEVESARILEVRDLTVTYGAKTAVTAVNLEIRQGRSSACWDRTGQARPAR